MLCDILENHCLCVSEHLYMECFICLQLNDRQIQLKLCVCVCVVQSEVWANARKHILWQHAGLLSDAAQEHDVRCSGCSKTSGQRHTHTHTAEVVGRKGALS